jgi:nicotinamidase-related amidase
MEQTQLKTALLVMDMQLGIIGNFAQVATELVNTTKKAIAHARQRKMPVIFVTVAFRQDGPQPTPKNKGFAAAKERFANADMDVFNTIVPELGRRNDEPQITKRALSAFAGSDLEMVLRSNDIQHLVLTGISTNGVVLSTLREATDKDYQLTVLADCCADSDEEVHRVLTTKIFPRHAEVMTVAEWVG